MKNLTAPIKVFFQSKTRVMIFLGVLIMIVGYVLSFSVIAEKYVYCRGDDFTQYAKMGEKKYENDEFIAFNARKLGEKATFQIELAKSNDYLMQNLKISKGSYVIVNELKDVDSNSIRYVVQDVYRIPIIIFLFFVFAGLLFMVSGIQGLNALFSMIVSTIMVIYVGVYFVLSGYSPVLVIVVCGPIVLFFSTFVSHGINKKSAISFVSSLIVLFMSYFMAKLFNNALRITGYTLTRHMYLTEEVVRYLPMILQMASIIGVLGVLDDVTINQINMIEVLSSDKRLKKIGDLYQKAMENGSDHIASMVNTLTFAYIAGSFFTVFSFAINKWKVNQILNLESIADEISRTFVGSIAIVIAVPLSTYLAALYYRKIDKAIVKKLKKKTRVKK